MRAAPSGLTDPVWLAWIAAAPEIEIDPRGDAFHKLAMAWLRQAPSPTPLDAADRQVVWQWLESYRNDVRFAARGEVSLGMADLEKAGWAVLGAGAGASLSKVVMVGALALNLGAVGLAVIGMGYAMTSVYRNSFKARRERMMLEIAQKICSIRDSL